jgi:hypothetical protein
MTPEEKANHVYLGDGVYLEHTPEHIILRTGDHRDSHCDNKIYLEDRVLNAMMMAIDRIKERSKNERQ